MAQPIFRGPGKVENIPMPGGGPPGGAPPPPMGGGGGGMPPGGQPGEPPLPPEPEIPLPPAPGGPAGDLQGAAQFNVGKGPLANRPMMSFADLAKGRFQQGGMSGPLQLLASGMGRGAAPMGGAGGPGGAPPVDEEMLRSIAGSLRMGGRKL